jgi:RNA polymerase sigma-70 factor (ECF subfamily)
VTDLQRYEQLFKKWYKAAVYIAETMIQNEGDAEDIATDAFIKLFQAKYIGDTYTNKKFLIKCIKNACLDYRRHQATIRRNRDEILHTTVDSEHFDELFDTMVIQQKTLAALPKAVNSLPTQCRSIFVMFWKGLKTDQIAAKMNLTPRTVLNQRTRAISLIRAAIGQ